MFPVSKPELSFAEISEYWGAELNLSQDKIEARLEEAWWLGEISGNPTPPTRLELLKSLFKRIRINDVPYIVFVTPEDTPRANTKELGDGNLLIDLRPRVPVPSGHPDTWSEVVCIQAFQAMAQIASSEYYPEYRPGFEARKLTRNEFFKWIVKRRFWLPKFWEETNDQTVSDQLKQAPQRIIEAVLRDVYDTLERPPNIIEVVKPVQAGLRERGYTVSGRAIQEVANLPEFKARRRPPGKTLKSEQRGPRT
jgi:hypothetical protein